MGQEVSSTLIRGRTRVPGRALLEGDHLLFRGVSERIKVLFNGLTKVESSGGRLSLTTRDGTVSLDLGALSDRWAEKIRNPRSLLDKLGVKPGMRVAVIDVADDAFDSLLRDRCPDVSSGKSQKGADIIFFGVESRRGLERLPALKRSLKPNGAIWVVHRKGKDATLKDVEVFAVARAAGLVDNKVASFSATHTAERLVIPLKDRVTS